MQLNENENKTQVPATNSERGGLGFAALAWLLGVPGIIILILLLL